MSQPTPKFKTSRPNIVLFLTDDHARWAHGCYGNVEVQTPNLDSLAREGVLFENAFTPTPVCSPARACLLTGRTASQVGIHDWLQEEIPGVCGKDWLDGEVTLPEMLSCAGYVCGLSGKWHLGQSYQTPRGFSWRSCQIGGDGHHEGHYSIQVDGRTVPLIGNKTKIFTDQALEFLDNVPLEQPFFLNIGYIATHSPYEAQAHDPETVALYRDATFCDIPEYKPHPWARNEGFPTPSGTPEQRRSRYMGYYSGATEIDRAVGRVRNALKQRGQLDNTLIIYTSDHGCSLGHHGFWGKGNGTRPLNMWDVSLRVPLIVRWPEAIRQGVRINSNVSHYDTFQTICALAGVTPDPARNCPGRSYETMLTNVELQQWDSTIFGEYGDLRMVRTPDWKLIVRYGHCPNELYDLKNDTQETNNLAGRPELASLQAQLSARIDRFYAYHEDPQKTGLNATRINPHNEHSPFHDGIRERNAAQIV